MKTFIIALAVFILFIIALRKDARDSARILKEKEEFDKQNQE